MPQDAVQVKKAAGDLSRYIGLLAETGRGSVSGQSVRFPEIADCAKASSSEPVIILNSDDETSLKNGFSWRARPERVEIYGESGRGLCNGIYSFLSALGISWPSPGMEKLPVSSSNNSTAPAQRNSQGFSLALDGVNEPSKYSEGDIADVFSRRFFPAGRRELKYIQKNGEAFAAWAARRRYDTVIFPLACFASRNKRKIQLLSGFFAEYGISLEAGGRDFSALVPRNNFFLHSDCFRMEEGRRNKDHHFCPTNPGTMEIIRREGEKLFRAAEGIKVFHLWQDKDAPDAWCSCPTCRAFTPQEQYRIAVSAAADVLAAVNPGAVISFYEKSGEEINIPLRKNLFCMEKIPEEKELKSII